ncbi:MAG: GNAT family N-acetyltransferase [Lachnospiraceae bacterium]|nr:GNAT family N-acetyltransferase [Lachnospiraceae bacterium]
MQIRKTVSNDLPRIMEIYAMARDFMAATGNPDQWGPRKWPPQELIERDILEGHSYVCVNEEDRVIATFYFNYGERVDPCYNVIEDGEWFGKDTYGVVHRIATDHSEKGIGSFCVNWAFDRCGHLRIDTHADNKVMQGMLAKLGFKHCGTIYVYEDHNPRLAFEKIK